MKVLVLDDTSTTVTGIGFNSPDVEWLRIEEPPECPEREHEIVCHEVIKQCRSGWLAHVSKIHIISKGVNIIRSINGQGWKKLF